MEWTAEDVAGQSLPWPCEVIEGRLQPLHRPPAWAGPAGHVARRLFDAAAAIDAWVSTELLVRVRRAPDTAWRPAVAVVAGDLPISGVSDRLPLLAVEHDLAAAARWQALGVVVWLPRDDGVTVVEDAGTRQAGPAEVLRLGAEGPGVAAATLCVRRPSTG